MAILQLIVRQVYNFSNQETVTNNDEYRNEKKIKQQNCEWESEWEKWYNRGI